MRYLARLKLNDYIQILIGVGVIIGTILIVFYSLPGQKELNILLNYEETERLNLVQENSIQAVSPAYFIIETEVLGCLVETTYPDDITLSGIVKKLAQCESGLNPKAHNPDDPDGGSFGILQFQKRTFQGFCVDKYGFEDDIWNTTSQIGCAIKMIEAGLGSHWSCWNLIQ